MVSGTIGEVGRHEAGTEPQLWIMKGILRHVYDDPKGGEMAVPVESTRSRDEEVLAD